MKRSTLERIGMGIGIVVLILLMIGIGTLLYRPFNKISDIRQVTTTVTEKGIKTIGVEGTYLIFTENKNGMIATYEITDSLFKGRFNSADVYAAIKTGTTYTFTVGGSRVEFLSWYPNIYEFEVVEE